MEIISTISDMVAWSQRTIAAGRTIALVPTMGSFHEGHLQLMRRAAQEAETVVVSIFVNPMQFGPQEDFASYPRDLDGDVALLGNVRVDALFVPAAGEMYPEGFATRIRVERLTETLCGLQRPGHFDGVATVVGKLLHIVGPRVAVFGEKDLQQLVVIRRLVKDLNWGVRIIGHPIVREADGLAMSSRNRYLAAGERQSALSLSRALETARQRLAGEEEDQGLDAAALIADLTAFIESHPGVRVEYVSLVDRHDLRAKEVVDRDTVLAMAVRVGKTRLIDNGLLIT